MNNEPMSDERLAIIRRGAQALDEHVAKGGAINWAEGVVAELLAEVDRLQRENNFIREADMRPADIQRRRADRAEAALARVIKFAEGLIQSNYGDEGERFADECRAHLRAVAASPAEGPR